MAEGRAKFAKVQGSDDGLSVGVRLRVALDVLEALGEAGVGLALRSPKSKLVLDRIEIDEEGLAHVDGNGDTTGAAQLVWEIIAGKAASWAGAATDDDLPDDVPGSVLDVLGGLLGEKGKAGGLGEKLEEASRGFVDTHDDVRSAVASWRDANPDEEEEAAPPPPPAPVAAPKPAPVASAPKPVEASAPAAPPAKPVQASAPAAPAKVEAPKPAPAPAPVAPAKAEAPKPAPAPVAVAPEPTPAPAKVEARKPVVARLPSEFPDAWDAPPLSVKLDEVLDEGKLPPPESVAPQAEAPAVAVPYPPVPGAPRAPSFPDEEEVADASRKPGRVAPPDPSAPPPPPSPMPPAPIQRAPQPTVPETKAARSFVETVPATPKAGPVAAAREAGAGLGVQSATETPRGAPAAPRAAPPRAPLKTDPLGTPGKARPPDPKKTEPMRPRPETNGSSKLANDLVDNGAADPEARSVDVIGVESKSRAPKPPEPPKAPPRKTVPDIKATEPFRRRLPGPEDPGGDEPPARGPLSRPLPPDTAALASDGPIPLPVQPPSPATPNAKVILEGADRMRAQMQTHYTRKDQVGPEPAIVQATPAAPPPPEPVRVQAPDFSIPAPPKKGKGAIIAVVIVAAIGIGVFAALASQIQGPPEVLPTPTVTAPVPSEATGAAMPPPTPPPAATPAEAAPAPTPTPEPVATAAPTSTARAGSHPAPHGTGSRGGKKWQPNLPDRL